jgi:hypothetical protein
MHLLTANRHWLCDFFFAMEDDTLLRVQLDASPTFFDAISELKGKKNRSKYICWRNRCITTGYVVVIGREVLGCVGDGSCIYVHVHSLDLWDYLDFRNVDIGGIYCDDVVIARVMVCF